MERAEANGLAATVRRHPDTPIERGADRPRRASVRSRRGGDPRRPACLRRGARRASKPARRASARDLSAPSTAASSSPGPAGSPSRGRRDVMPTGRNLATLDPRAIPTRAAAALGERAAAEVIRRHLQDEGDYPRRIVMDLWASPTLRSGGEDIAHALALMGVRPRWDLASTRVTGFEIVPPPLLDASAHRRDGPHLGRLPRHLSRPDRAARPGRARGRRPRRGRRVERARRRPPPRRTPAAGLRRRAGPFRRGRRGDRARRRVGGRDDLGRTYLALTSHAFGAARRTAAADPPFAERVADADAFVHVSDVAERDLLDGDSTGDAIGGFAAAARKLGATPALYSLDTSRAGGAESADAARGHRPARARPPRPSALDRGAVAPRLARRGGAGAGRGRAVRFRRDDGGRHGRRARRRVRRLLAADAARERLFAANPAAARPSATASPTRAGAASGRAAATRSRRTSATGFVKGGRRMIRPATPPMRRGGCPGRSRPMPTGDGLLVRLHPPGALTAAQARAVADAARPAATVFWT